MRSISFADQMCLLDDLVEQLCAVSHPNSQLIKDAKVYVARLPEDTRHAALCRHIHELIRSCPATRIAPSGKAARAGLSYLVTGGGPEPQNLSALALRAHEYLLGLMVHQARRERGETTSYIPPALSNEDRNRAEEIYRELLETMDTPDALLIEQTRSFVDAPGLPAGSLFVSRLLRNAEFLAQVLESGDDEANRNVARAALGYLILEEDSIDDRLGLIGFLDDAYILDTAVAVIEPAREPWIRLMESARIAWPLLAEASVGLTTGQSAPVIRHVLTQAALLAEPQPPGSGPLDSALFVPTAGSPTILLGVSVLAEMCLEVVEGSARLKREEEQDTFSSLSDVVSSLDGRPLPQTVVVVAPIAQSQALCEHILIDGATVTELLPLGHVDAEGNTHSWGEEHRSPRLLFVDTLEQAAQFEEEHPGSVRMVLVDLLVGEAADASEGPAKEAAQSTGEDIDEDALPVDEEASGFLRPRKQHSKRSVAASQDLLNRYMDEASTIARLTLEEENRLSDKMIDARTRMWRSAHKMGPGLFDSLTPANKRVAASFDRYREVAREHLQHMSSASADEELTAAHGRQIAELGLEDDHFAQALKAHKATYSGARKNKPPQFKEQKGTSPEQFVEGYKHIRLALHEIEECVTVLTRANLRLVLWMAKKYRGRSFYLDMIQEGNLGLMRASRKFDHRKGARFGSYAGWWIRQALEGYLSRQSRTIRIPVNTLSLIRRVTRAKQAMGDQQQRVPTASELSKATGIDESDVKRALRIGHDLERGCVALDGPMDGESSASLSDVIPDPNAPQPLEEISGRQLAEEARRLLETLEPLESEVIHLRFGLGDHDRHTLAAIGEKVGLTKERIRQIELKALSKLRFRAKRAGVRP